ncbi:M43 family zinc metalloprotease [Flavobacterium sp. MFBS3-15]|uniref:M43 family zinc metalloprotease n=1 Tax=Flavobacterium sp. MFBS3-15 TaxID=2989816 RepID=UPI0022368879|nr:M43 family zinc metalloprotease [Flavobacterium sp. MFBS3-15]MCW4468645.1 M43 family zinc metalloprotease [Flavobacterium sp. MFBS3-15]
MENSTFKKGMLFLSALLSVGVLAQERQQTPKQFGPPPQCGTTEYETYLQQRNPNRSTTGQFEQWLAPKVNAIKNNRLRRNGNTTDNNVQIPVVVHIVHNGDALGVNENITDAQVLSQIEVLNQDYRRIAGTPGYNENPVGADTGITFCLAQQDPQGRPTTGIIRHQYNFPAWEMNAIETVLKPETHWDTSLYLNVWIVSDILLFGTPALKGYAQLPEDLQELDGLPYQGKTEETDGVVIAARFFGSPAIYPQGNYAAGTFGRTATHEIGHFLGLRHIWGDGGCDIDDFCEDTPVASGPTQGNCPAGKDSCLDNPGMDMIENYMDYSSETCMNVFTQDQKDRIHAVLAHSPRRASLAVSQACTPVEERVNDGSLEIQGIDVVACSADAVPEVLIYNAGTSAITSAVITYWADNDTPATYNWTGSLAPGTDTVAELPAITAIPGGHILHVSLTTVNGEDDENGFNDNKNKTFITAPVTDADEVTITVTQDIFGADITWQLKNSFNVVVASGGPYQDLEVPVTPFPTYTQTVAIEEGHCYTFTINDSFGDGICCDLGYGNYTISAGNILLARGATYTTSDTRVFKVSGVLGNQNSVNAQGITLFPNPAHTMINLKMDNPAEAATYAIYNNLGQLVGKGKIESDGQGIDIANYANGVYSIKVDDGNATQSLRFIKQ